jgi:hypothetical protein
LHLLIPPDSANPQQNKLFISLFIVFLHDPFKRNVFSKIKIDRLVLELVNSEELHENVEEFGIKLGSRNQVYMT